MAEPNTRDSKLIQYLNEAYGKEKELEVALQAHIGMAAGRKPYQKRLREHLKETKAHGRDVARRIKQLGGKAEASALPDAAAKVQEVASKGLAAAKGPLHAIRGTGEAEKLLKNAKTEFFNEHEEIATYNAIETLAEAVGDKDTAKLAKTIRREEERMAAFLERQITALAKAVATEEIPASERRRSSPAAARPRAATAVPPAPRPSRPPRAAVRRPPGRRRRARRRPRVHARPPRPPGRRHAASAAPSRSPSGARRVAARQR